MAKRRRNPSILPAIITGAAGGTAYFAAQALAKKYAPNRIDELEQRKLIEAQEIGEVKYKIKPTKKYHKLEMYVYGELRKWWYFPKTSAGKKKAQKFMKGMKAYKPKGRFKANPLNESELGDLLTHSEEMSIEAHRELKGGNLMDAYQLATVALAAAIYAGAYGSKRGKKGKYIQVEIETFRENAKDLIERIRRKMKGQIGYVPNPVNASEVEMQLDMARHILTYTEGLYENREYIEAYKMAYGAQERLVVLGEIGIDFFRSPKNRKNLSIYDKLFNDAQAKMTKYARKVFEQTGLKPEGIRFPTGLTERGEFYYNRKH